MSTTTIPPGADAPGLRLFRDRLGERPLTQVALFVGLTALIAFLGRNLAENMARVGIVPGFAFLQRPANFEIGESLIAYSAEMSYARAFLVGVLNTLAASAAGCLLATLLGAALGIARLSTNPLLAGSARAYVEAVRNTPLLLQLFFWSAVLHALPSARQALQPLPGLLLSNRGVFLPVLRFEDERWWLVALGLGAVFAMAWIAVGRRLGERPARRRRARSVLILAFLGALAAAAVLLGVTIEVPQQKGFNIAGGLSLTTEFSALLIGLTVNAAAGIAEIVRSGIEAVPAGQWEAAGAVGLHKGQTLRLVVLPQALRVIVPLMTSSYLSLAKNSSLAVAIGYPDLVSIANTAANQTGQVLESLLIMMAVYLAMSFTVSWLMNRYHARLALRER